MTTNSERLLTASLSRVANGYVLYDGDEYCHYCGDPIITMCFKGTGVCCEDCRKQRDGEA